MPFRQLTLACAMLALAAPAMATETIAPIQAVVSAVGDKQVVAFYTAAPAGCAFTLMIDERAELREELGLPITAAARLQVTLSAGQGVALDGPRAERLAFTCEAGGMTVDHRPAEPKLASN